MSSQPPAQSVLQKRGRDSDQPETASKEKRTSPSDIGTSLKIPISKINGSQGSPYIGGVAPSLKDMVSLAFSNEESRNTLDNYCFNREGTIGGRKKVNKDTIKAFLIPRTEELDDESKTETQQFCEGKTDDDLQKATPGSIVITNNITQAEKELLVGYWPLFLKAQIVDQIHDFIENDTFGLWNLMDLFRRWIILFPDYEEVLIDFFTKGYNEIMGIEEDGDGEEDEEEDNFIKNFLKGTGLSDKEIKEFPDLFEDAGGGSGIRNKFKSIN